MARLNVEIDETRLSHTLSHCIQSTTCAVKSELFHEQLQVKDSEYRLAINPPIGIVVKVLADAVLNDLQAVVLAVLLREEYGCVIRRMGRVSILPVMVSPHDSELEPGTVRC